MDIRTAFLNVFLWLALALISVSGAQAAQSLDNMYEAIVPLEDRSDAARSAAIEAGLIQVLTRYSGYSGIDGLFGVSEALLNSESYVIEFAVETEMVPSEDNLSVEKSEALWIRYNASLVDSLFDRQQLPIWSSLRPEVKYLVVQELWGEPTLMTPESFPAMGVALDSMFSKRGLPASPFESPSLSVDRIWEMGEVDAFTLYHESEADLLFLIRVLNEGAFGQRSEVVVVQESGLSVYREQAGNPVFDTVSAIDQFVDSYSTQYAFLGGIGQISDIYISVLGLKEFSAYRRLLDVLSGLEQVSNARLEGFKGDQMLFRVAYGSNQERLVADLGKQLGLTTVPSQFNALGTRTSPLTLASPDYQVPEFVEQIFAQPVIAEPLSPLEIPVGVPMKDSATDGGL